MAKKREKSLLLLAKWWPLYTRERRPHEKPKEKWGKKDLCLCLGSPMPSVQTFSWVTASQEAGPCGYSQSTPDQLEAGRAFPLLLCSFVQKTALESRPPCQAQEKPQRGRGSQARQTSLTPLLLLRGPFPSSLRGGQRKQPPCTLRMVVH